MRIKQPAIIREKLMKRHGWVTVDDIARGLKMSTHTVSKALRGLPVRTTSIIKVAAALEEGVADIATFVGRG